jgi:acyl dehydratase
MTDSASNLPPTEFYFEDYIPGAVYEFGSVVMEEKEILEFGRRYDPQVFHTDPEAAKKTPFGGLVASGWHTAAVAMRILVDHFVSHVAGLGSPGADELRWLKPVRPGDELSVRATILGARPSQSRPGQGITRSLIEVLNQRREVVMTWIGIGILRCREFKK